MFPNSKEKRRGMRRTERRRCCRRASDVLRFPAPAQPIRCECGAEAKSNGG